YYVAMTRAVERLIVSGAIDSESAADSETPIGWILERLSAEVLERAGEEPEEIACGESSMLLRVDRFTPRAEQPEVAAGEEVGSEDQLSLFQQGLAPAPEPVAAEPLEPLEPIPSPALHRPRRLSYSALRLFKSCSYRYFAERVCGMKAPPQRPDGAAGAGLAATELGSAVHELLEAVDLTAPAPPASTELEQSVRSRYPATSNEDLERIARLVSNYCDSELAQRVAQLPEPATELNFVFDHGDVLVNGFLDVASFGDGKAFVLDYKTNRIDTELEQIVESEYGLQRLVYALACLRAGYEEVEVAYAFLERPDAVVSAVYRAGDALELERELGALIEQVVSGDFSPTPSVLACSDCPANGVVCAGMDLPAAPPRLAAVSDEN
ncbi:MAG: PD-(D/E)XK nuclease family protein, partial [Gaiellaceae bacterium]